MCVLVIDLDRSVDQRSWEGDLEPVPSGYRMMFRVRLEAHCGETAVRLFAGGGGVVGGSCHETWPWENGGRETLRFFSSRASLRPRGAW